jgi:3-deoxy-D-manno-octulosonic-acid transferase
MLFKIFFYAVFLPLVFLVRTFLFWVPAIRKRVEFEKKNHHDPASRSFRLDQHQADIAFEFSSEGEFQQVASLVHDSLAAGKRVELILFSPSVEKAVMELASRFPQQLRYLRYPILGRGFTPWITSRELIMVRYDLFPEFLAWANDDRKLKMLWMSFKKDRVRGKSPSLLKKLFLKRIDKVIYASVEDQNLGSRLGFPGHLYDFRLEQITRRLDQKSARFQEVFPQYAELKDLWEKFPREKRLIIGNAWPSDLQIMSSLPDDFFVMVVPHKLDAEVLKTFRDELSRKGRVPEEVNKASRLLSGHTFILNKKGVLCELYADFGKSYVGGGFETSIHSVLEPLVAGSEQLACGPLHHRSTEYDLAKEYGDIRELKTSGDFKEWLESHPSQKKRTMLTSLIKKYPEFRREVISC